MNTDSAYSVARIKRVQTERIQNELDKKKIVLVAGFQGINKYGDITTLGRGGSDTSAVALAAALHADLCQIYTDVDGVYTADPRLVKGAKKLEEITFDEMLELASLGARCSTTARWRWPSAITSIWRSSPVSRVIPVQKSRRLSKPWKDSRQRRCEG